jgi:uncharacterized protein involved in exopolysaccharide biosynthesis
VNESQGTTNYLREYAFILFAQRRLILATALVVFLAFAAVAFLWPTTWGAAGSLIVKGRTETSVASLEEAKPLLETTRKEDLFSEASIVTSHNVLTTAAQALRGRERFRGEQLTPATLRLHLEVTVLPSSNVIELLLTWRDPDAAQEILQAVMEAYLSFRNSIFNPPERRDLFDARSRDYMQSLEQKQGGVLAAIKDVKAPDPELEIKHNLEIKQHNLKKLQMFREELTDTEFLIEQIANDLDEETIKFYSYINLEPITVLNSKLQELIIRQNGILKTYLPDSKRAQAARREVLLTSKMLRAEVVAYKQNLDDRVSALQAKTALLEDEVARIDARNLELKTLDLRLKNIDQESQLFRLSFDTFSKRREEVDFTNQAGGAASYVSVIAEAHVLEDPVFPDKAVLLPLGLLAGLLGGFSLGFIREFADHRFKRPEDVEKQLGLPVIFSIPDTGEATLDASPAASDESPGDGGKDEAAPPPDQAPAYDPSRKFTTLLGWTDRSPPPDR